MSRSALLPTNEIPATTTTMTAERRFLHGLMPANHRSSETLPMVVQSLPIRTANKSMAQSNQRHKRNLRDKRRSTGIRPTDVSLASTSTEGSPNDDELAEEEDSNGTYVADSSDSSDHNRNMTSTKPTFAVNRVQSSFENLSIPRTESYMITSSSATKTILRPSEFLLRRVEKQTVDDDLSTLKSRQLEEHIRALESIVHEKDAMIYDLQRKLDNANRDLTDAEQQIYLLHQDKLTLIKAFATLQDDKPSAGDLSTCSSFATRN